ncbi:DUF2341 domain-containing protein [Ideonella sp. DXS22W]|uniref:DUF2341 domain-containing protein n=1 Tax=Pseudaquabacterium inlustre TaxID=2984192 RepID=A0ABU9CDS6_9BURK
MTNPISRSPARRLQRGLALALAAGTLALSPAAHAWWNADWSQRTRVTLDTTDKGQAIGEAVSQVPLAIRLHSGNFDFLAGKDDGSDLRVLAADDKTVLPHRLERFDATNELAVLWVQVPSVAPGSDKNVVYVYTGNAKAPAATPAAASGGDAALKFAVHFDDQAAPGIDAVGQLRPVGALTPEPAGLLGAGARLAGTPLVWPVADGIKVAPNGAATLSLWARADGQAQGQLLALGPLSLALADGKVVARVGTVALTGGGVTPGSWLHVALVLEGSQARLHVNGAEVAKAAVATPEVAGEMRVGEGFTGAVDEINLAGTARSGAWLAVQAGSQGPAGLLVKSAKEASGEGEAGGGHGYFKVLFDNLTTDAWVVILILAAMFVVAAAVMVTKLRYILRADNDNRRFLGRFRDAGADLLKLDAGATHPNSSLYRLYLAGQRELVKRGVGAAEGRAAQGLSGASLDAVKASVDADLVRESHKLNAQMVWLTIAISGGPFLGLLGTVVGVMITFAAIAAAGDVNVNAIAPGIAAALLATVAGLSVAIPSLFGYNYLASRIKNISADMQIFVDEFITRVAEEFGSR